MLRRVRCDNERTPLRRLRILKLLSTNARLMPDSGSFADSLFVSLRFRAARNCRYRRLVPRFLHHRQQRESHARNVSTFREFPKRGSVLRVLIVLNDWNDWNVWIGAIPVLNDLNVLNGWNQRSRDRPQPEKVLWVVLNLRRESY